MYICVICTSIFCTSIFAQVTGLCGEAAEIHIADPVDPTKGATWA